MVLKHSCRLFDCYTGHVKIRVATSKIPIVGRKNTTQYIVASGSVFRFSGCHKFHVQAQRLPQVPCSGSAVVPGFVFRLSGCHKNRVQI